MQLASRMTSTSGGTSRMLEDYMLRFSRLALSSASFSNSQAQDQPG